MPDSADLSAPPATPPGTSNDARTRVRRVALLGNPNVGKTTLFNRLCGLRAKTANFPGSTVDARVGTIARDGATTEIVDLPGIYALDLDLPESKLCRDCLAGRLADYHPDALLVVVDATNLERNLQFALSALRSGLPAVVVVTMTDVAARKGLSIDDRALGEHLGCPVVIANGRTGEGIDRLVSTLQAARTSAAAPNQGESMAEWAGRVVEESVGGERASGTDHDSIADRLDSAFTHPVLGTAIFALVMAALFVVIFWLAATPMDLLEEAFGALASWVRELLPEGLLADLLADGVVNGLASTLVFLPQICLLFFLLSLLEDTGYLARAAFVMDRIMCRFGLPGQAFVPLLSSHACALPGIMSTRLIPDRSDRLATILVAPFMSCSARVPVYVLLTSLLFPTNALRAGLAFAGCYILGAIAALGSAAIFRRTILKGRSRPMVLELPTYKWPSLRAALLVTVDRARTFLVNAGTIIMAISIVMWWLSAFPRVEPPAPATELRAKAETLADDDAKAELVADAERLESEAQQRGSFAGMLGNAVQPVFAPLGYDRQLTVAVLTSFLAREVFVTTMTVLVGTDDDIEDERVRQRLATATRDDGSPLFDVRTNASLLVFFVLAMQCLPTLAVTRRESGSWKWALLQLGWMSVVAYVAAFATYQGLGLLGAGAA
ncbi:MAG: ferrous iron transporter B [Phycisphaerae bacterium]|nr:ferrous iron transporter B [Phycisphaerae bacterium]